MMVRRCGEREPQTRIQVTACGATQRAGGRRSRITESVCVRVCEGAKGERPLSNASLAVSVCQCIIGNALSGATSGTNKKGGCAVGTGKLLRERDG